MVPGNFGVQRLNSFTDKLKTGCPSPQRIQLNRGPKRNLSLKFLRSSIISLPSYTHSLTCSNFSLSSHSHPLQDPAGQIRAEDGHHTMWMHRHARAWSLRGSALSVVGLTRSHVGVLRPRGRDAARLASARGCRAGRPAPPALMPRSLAPGVRLIHQLELLVLLFQEEVHQQALFFLDLVADVRGDIWDHPVYEDAQEHHQVLPKARERVERRGLAGNTGVPPSSSGLHCDRGGRVQR